MRLFIAIQFDKNILDALTDFQADLKSQGVTGNYTRRENLHITLIRKYSCRGGKGIPISDPPKGSMKATRVSLMRSERGRNGMIYTELGSIGMNYQEKRGQT